MICIIVTRAVCPRITHLLHLLHLLLALTLFGAGSAVADVRHSHGSDVPGAGEASSYVFADPQTSVPERDDSVPRANKLCKHRIRGFTVATAIRIDVAHASAACAGPCQSFAGCSIADAAVLPRGAFSHSHDCPHASPRLLLKLQLGQAP